MKDLFLQDLQAARERRTKLLYERTQIEARLAWENSQIAHLERLTGAAGEGASLADVIQAVVENGGLSEGLTDSCRRVLKVSPRPLRANELVLVLEKSGLSVSRYVDALSAVTTVLHRLKERGEARVAGTENGWPLFSWTAAKSAQKHYVANKNVTRRKRRTSK